MSKQETKTKTKSKTKMKIKNQLRSNKGQKVIRKIYVSRDVRT